MLSLNMFSFVSRIRLTAGIAFLVILFSSPIDIAMAQTSAQEQSSQYDSGMRGEFDDRTAVAPDSASNCNPNPLYVVQQCTQVIGAGLEINSISGTGINWGDTALTEVHIQIYGPNGTIQNCTQFTLAAYATSPTCTWKNPNPTKQMTAGDYCSRTWMYDGSGYVDMDSECIDVHS